MRTTGAERCQRRKGRTDRPRATAMRRQRQRRRWPGTGVTPMTRRDSTQVDQEAGHVAVREPTRGCAVVPMTQMLLLHQQRACQVPWAQLR